LTSRIFPVGASTSKKNLRAKGGFQKIRSMGKHVVSLVQPCILPMLLCFYLAPTLERYRTIAVFPVAFAKSSGVLPMVFLALASALWETRNLATSMFPTSAEVYRRWGAIFEKEWIGHSNQVFQDNYLTIQDSDYEAAARWEISPQERSMGVNRHKTGKKRLENAFTG